MGPRTSAYLLFTWPNLAGLRDLDLYFLNGRSLPAGIRLCDFVFWSVRMLTRPTNFVRMYPVLTRRVRSLLQATPDREPEYCGFDSARSSLSGASCYFFL